MARPKQIICRHCGKPAPNNLKRGPQRLYHQQCYDEARKERQQRKREDPAYRKRERDRERDRREMIKKDPNRRRQVREGRRDRRRRQREDAERWRRVGPELKRLQLRIDALESAIADDLIVLRRRVQKLEEHTDMPGHKATGL